MKTFYFTDAVIMILVTVALCFANKNDFNHREHETGALDALQFLSAMNAYPYADVPAGAYAYAYNYYKANYNHATSKVNLASSWQSIGPSNVGGRTISIAVNPVDTNIIWLGSASGGLWKSTVGGIGANAWQYIPTGFPVLGVASIAINPQNTNEMYIGTGETYDYGTSLNGLIIRTTRGSNGIGILKSSDGGLTWTHTLNWLYDQRRGVWDIIINPLNPQTVFAATTEGVYKTTNGGTTWTQVLTNTMVMDLEMDANDTTILYAGAGNLTSANKGLYKTSNAGASWTLLTNGLPANTQQGRMSITTYKSNTNIVMVHIADQFNTVGLYRSTNKGQTFTAVSTGTNIAGAQGWYASGIKMKDDDSSQVFIAGQLLWASTSWGSNPFQFTNYNPYDLAHTPWPDIHGVSSNPFDADKIYLLTDAGLYRSDDFGQNWYSCLDGYVVSQFYIGDVSATDSTIAIGGLQDRNTQLYNGSVNWNFHPNGDGTFTAIDKTNDQVQYTAGQYLFIEQSTDGGQSFSNFIFSGSGAAFTAPFALAPSNQNLMYAGDININQVYIPTGTVTTYPGVAGQPLLSIAVSATNDQKIYFTTEPVPGGPLNVFRSADGGATQNDISQNLPDRYPRHIEVNPLNDNTVYVVYSGFGTGHIFKSTDAGNSWTDMSTTLPDIPFHSLLINPNDTSIVYAGCDFGVFYSTNSGATWQVLNDGLPEAVMVFDLKYSPADNNLVAFTHGHGVYKIDLTDLNAGIADLQLTTVRLYPVPSNDFIYLDCNAAKQLTTTIKLFDTRGTICLLKNITLMKGKNHLRIDISQLKDGIYFMDTDNKYITGRILKM